MGESGALGHPNLYELRLGQVMAETSRVQVTADRTDDGN